MESQYAYDKIYNQLVDDIKGKKYKKGDLLPYEKELCLIFHVSLTTVRRALYNLEKDGIVRKVKGKGTVVSDVLYHPKLGQNKNIGILFIPFKEQYDYKNKYEYTNYWMHRIYKELYTELNQDFYILADEIKIDGFEKSFQKSVLRYADKIFITGLTDLSVIKYLQSINKYVVVYNLFDPNVEVCSICNNEREAFCNAVEYLFDNGHTKIATINGIISSNESLERFMGYQEALVRRNVLIEPDYIKWGDMTPESGFRLMGELLALDEKSRPTAVMCVNDGVAMGAFDAITKAGYRVPEDISLIGHDNSYDERVLKTKKLHTIDPHYERVGRMIAEKLKRDIWINDRITVESEFVIGESVKKI